MFNLFPLGGDDAAVSGSADDDGDVVLINQVSQKSVPQNPKRKASFTKTYCQGMKVIVFGKSNRPRGPRPVERINFNSYSKESETSG